MLDVELRVFNPRKRQRSPHQLNAFVFDL